MVRISHAVVQEMFEKTDETSIRDAIALEERFPGITEASKAASLYWPTDARVLFHPKGFLFSTLPYLTCRRFERVEGSVDLHLSLDASEGTPLHFMMEEMAPAFQEFDGDEEFVAALVEVLRHLPELVAIHMRLDEETGVLQSMEISILFTPSEFDIPDSDGTLRLDYRLEGTARKMLSLPAERFRPDWPPTLFDADGIIQGIIAELEEETAAL